MFLGNERGLSKDIPNEHHWWDIDWIISGCKSLLVVIAYCNHKQLDSDKTIFATKNVSSASGLPFSTLINVSANVPMLRPAWTGVWPCRTSSIVV